MPDLAQKAYVIRVVDDDAELLDAVEYLLGCYGWKVQTHQSGREFVDTFDPAAPGVILLDVRMPDMGGPEVQQSLNRLGNYHPIVFLTGHGNLDLAVNVFVQGAFHFLQKPVDPNQLVDVLGKAIDEDDRRRKEREKNSPAKKWQSLTDRERDIMRLVAKGLPNKDIAEYCGISSRTVEVHRARGLRKLGLAKAQEVAEFLAAGSLR